MEKKGMEPSQIRIVNDMSILSFEDKYPVIHQSVFIAPGARIIGDVTIGLNSSIWFNCVVRGDVHFVRIGEFTNIQDGSVLHVTSGTNPLIVGNYVTVGHKACLHGCTVEDYSLVGIGAIVLDGAVVRKNSLVAAGALVPPNFEVPSGKLVAGVPAKIIRDLRPQEIDYFQESAFNYFEYARNTAKGIK